MLIIRLPHHRVTGTVEIDASVSRPFKELNDHELRSLKDMIEQEQTYRLNLPTEFDEEAFHYVRTGNKLGLIKHIRYQKGLGLGDAKALVDRSWKALTEKVGCTCETIGPAGGPCDYCWEKAGNEPRR